MADSPSIVAQAGPIGYDHSRSVREQANLRPVPAKVGGGTRDLTLSHVLGVGGGGMGAIIGMTGGLALADELFDRGRPPSGKAAALSIFTGVLGALSLGLVGYGVGEMLRK